MMLYVKEYLENEVNELSANVSLTDASISVGVDGENILIEIPGGAESVINVEVYDQYGNLICVQNNVQSLVENKYVLTDYRNNLSGLYLLKIGYNDNIYTKKLRI